MPRSKPLILITLEGFAEFDDGCVAVTNDGIDEV